MTEVQVSIDGIVLYCDESISNISLGNGYSITKQKLDELPYKTRVVDGNGNLSINYLGSRMNDNGAVSFMCLHKADTHQITFQTAPGMVITDRDTMCEDQLSAYKDREMDYLHKMFSLLRLFKAGNIGCKEIFFAHKFTVMDFINNTQTQTNDSVTRNIVDNRVYSLDADEIADCNNFIQKYAGKEYDLLNDCIQEFIWGLEQTDIPTGFEQFTTALEMLFLKKNQPNKKQALSKRVAVLLGKTPTEVTSLYKKMMNFYRYRSESLHEGNGKNITATELIELEDITRKSLQEFMSICNHRVHQKQNVTWQEIKAGEISDLRNQVGLAIKAGTLPEGNDTLIEKIKAWFKNMFKK